MKCNFCGSELKDGCLFCPSCGKDIQIVPDYNEFDDVYLNNFLNEDEDEIAKPVNIIEEETDTSQKKNTYEIKKKKQQRIKMLILSISSAIIAISIIVFCVINNINTRNYNSIEYQIQKAQQALDNRDYEKALSYYNRALELDVDNVDIYFAIADIYILKNDELKEIETYKKIIQIDGKNKDAYEALIRIYDEKREYNSILDLYASADKSMADCFAEYMVLPPMFSRSSGTYNEFFELSLTSEDGYKILYTLDGSDPTVSGIDYSVPIDIDCEKNYTVKACCVNKKGLYSEVLTKEYSISISAPKMPTVTPDGGNFVEDTYVTISVPAGCIAYYTWDETTPNVYSSKYTSALKIPEGNNVLSVILYDTVTGKYSDVYRGRFEYVVQREEEDTREDDTLEDIDEIDNTKEESIDSSDEIKDSIE